MSSVSQLNIDDLLDKASNGNIRAIGRLLSFLEDPYTMPEGLLEKLAKRTGKAQVIGVTGIPGSGKSTLISRLITNLRRKGYKVAIIAIDPSSPISGGALLGDRLRMQEHATDPGVFIRSVSSKGLKGGLSLAALTMIEAFDAFGYDKIIIETVGVGQSEVDIMSVAHTIVVVTMPGAGDDIQALKAGVMEIGDIYVLNKEDKEEANKTFEYLSFALEKGDVGKRDSSWNPKLIKTSAIMGRGIDDLVQAIDEHYEYIKSSEKLFNKAITRRILMIKLLAEQLLVESIKRASTRTEQELENAAKDSSEIFNKSVELAKEACNEINNLVKISPELSKK
ncbi:MAG: methylmalonyl Co-A mutase-associated GTPase MeaB [Caldisphaera sp.]|nr:methylmalonyl Co-A mutase-associated GTPase MeaB [Caldisphaera sp.]PMP59653.1 MAG: methylmalonyl Co-A mutase-associated GTPase MeaB [Caldisphaera sp.]